MTASVVGVVGDVRPLPARFRACGEGEQLAVDIVINGESCGGASLVLRRDQRNLTKLFTSDGGGIYRGMRDSPNVSRQSVNGLSAVNPF